MTWTPYNYGTGPRIWWLCDDETGEAHMSRAGNVVRYKTYETARRAARRLGEMEKP